MSIREDFKHINQMLEFADNGIAMAKDNLYSTLEERFPGLEASIVSRLKIPNKKEIKEMTEHDIDKILINISPEKDESQINILMESYNELTEDEKAKYKDFADYKKSVFLDIKKEILDIEELEKSKNDIINQANEISEDYFKYTNSEEYRNKRNEKIEQMKDNLIHCEDPVEKRKIKKMLDGIENASSLSFLFSRFEKLGKKEVENTKNIFFDSNRSSLVMDKLRAKLPRYGYNVGIYKMFFNLEETFLPEKYHPLNNIFLFHVTRTIAYMNTEDKVDSLYTSTILQKMYNLIYHRFSNNEDEKEFIEIIKRVDDYFMDYIESFIKYNITAPNHPSRLEQNKKHEEKRRLMLITAIQNAGMMDVDTNAETEELEKILTELTTPHPEVEELEVTEDMISIEPSNKYLDEFKSKLIENCSRFKTETIAEQTKEFEENSNKFINSIVTIYKDRYGDFYSSYTNNKNDSNYIFFDKDGNIVDENIEEKTVLQLLSVGELEKVNINVVVK